MECSGRNSAHEAAHRPPGVDFPLKDVSAVTVQHGECLDLRLPGEMQPVKALERFAHGGMQNAYGARRQMAGASGSIRCTFIAYKSPGRMMKAVASLEGERGCASATVEQCGLISQTFEKSQQKDNGGVERFPFPVYCLKRPEQQFEDFPVLLSFGGGDEEDFTDEGGRYVSFQVAAQMNVAVVQFRLGNKDQGRPLPFTVAQFNVGEQFKFVEESFLAAVGSLGDSRYSAVLFGEKGDNPVGLAMVKTFKNNGFCFPADGGHLKKTILQMGAQRCFRGDSG